MGQSLNLEFKVSLTTRDSSAGRAEDCSRKCRETKTEILRSVVQIRLARWILFGKTMQVKLLNVRILSRLRHRNL